MLKPAKLYKEQIEQNDSLKHCIVVDELITTQQICTVCNAQIQMHNL